VLERPCPECGFVASACPREQVGTMLRANAAEWQRLLGSPDVASRPAADVWSALEYACLVASLTCTRAGAEPPRRAELAG